MKEKFNSLMLVWVFIAFTMLALPGCEGPPPTADLKLAVQQEQLSLQAANSVGMPGITKFAEKRMMKTIIELRDKEQATYTYIVSMNNELKLLCHSVGYGLPYATQYTSPSKIDDVSASPYAHAGSGDGGHVQGWYVMPQADPNGLFSPAAAEGTWVMCLDPGTKLAVPLYIEPRVIVSPFALQ